MKTVLITGITGMVGRQLAKKLNERGYVVRGLSRKKMTSNYYWNPAKNEIDDAVFENLDAIIHLAGASVVKRWTKAYKKELCDSRIDSAKLLLNRIKKQSITLKTFISASGVNYYGTETTDKIYTETVSNSDDFIGRLCAGWERAAFDFETVGSRVCVVRTAVVLSTEGGLLKKLINPAKMYMVSALGSGKQIVPWIHIDDLTELYVYLLENQELSGAFNAVSDQELNNNAFTQELVSVMNRKVILPNIPSFMLRILFGETASIMLNGSAVSNKKIKDAGFHFKYNQLRFALEQLMKK